jgi:hypothetical protein
MILYEQMAPSEALDNYVQVMKSMSSPSIQGPQIAQHLEFGKRLV